MKTHHETNSRIPDPPSGFRAIPWRLPIWLYYLRLGWLLGRRFLLLTHTGRISGKRRHAVLEVIKVDETNNVHYVASGFGRKSNWYRNIKKTPLVTIQSGGKKILAKAVILPTEEGLRILHEYQEKYPNAIKNLARIIGYQMGETEEEIQDFLQQIPIIAFEPMTM
jgi:deazaflavin-dependent oxidoreductase (nitroreductase family)